MAETERIYSCEVKKLFLRNGEKVWEWVVVNVADAIRDDATQFRCKDCHGAVRLHDDIGRLNVAVNYITAMRVSQCVADLLQNFQLVGERLRSAGLDQAIERIASQILHDDVRESILLTEVVDRNNVGMAERTGFGCFLIEPLQHLLVAGESFCDGFDRDLAIKLAIKGAVDEAHPAATKKVDHLVLADALYVWSSHRRSRLSG